MKFRVPVYFEVDALNAIQATELVKQELSVDMDRTVGSPICDDHVNPPVSSNLLNFLEREVGRTGIGTTLDDVNATLQQSPDSLVVCKINYVGELSAKELTGMLKQELKTLIETYGGGTEVTFKMINIPQ